MKEMIKPFYRNSRDVGKSRKHHQSCLAIEEAIGLPSTMYIPKSGGKPGLSA